jgi:hypothetical protein
VREVGSQALPVQESAVGATHIFHEIALPALMDLAMATRDPALDSAIRRQVQIGKDAVIRVQTPDVYLGRGWQLNPATYRKNLDSQWGHRLLGTLSARLTGPGIGLCKGQFILW